MTDKELLQEALDALTYVGDKAIYSDTIDALRARLAQREWVGLTDEEKVEIQTLKWWDFEDTFDLDGYTRAVETKLKEKNT